MNVNNIKVALIQTDIKAKKDENIEKILNYTKNFDADLYCLPEVFSTGFNYKNLIENAESISGETIQKLKETGKTITGTFVEKSNDKIYNTAFFISEGKLLGTYRKIHLFNLEKNVFSSGNTSEVIKTKFGKFLCEICYHFAPERLDDFEDYIAEKVDKSVSGVYRKFFQTRGEKQKLGMIKKSSQGEHMSRPPFGYEMNINGELIPAENFREVI